MFHRINNFTQVKPIKFLKSLLINILSKSLITKKNILTRTWSRSGLPRRRCLPPPCPFPASTPSDRPSPCRRWASRCWWRPATARCRWTRRRRGRYPAELPSCRALCRPAAATCPRKFHAAWSGRSWPRISCLWEIIVFLTPQQF